VKSKGEEEGTMIVQEPVAAKDVISTNEVDNMGMPKEVPIQHLSSILQWKYPIFWLKLLGTRLVLQAPY
jgi:hypothetical protein